MNITILLVLHLSALLRLLRAYDYVRKQVKKEGKKFEWNIYWSDRWDNWLMHFISMWIGVLLMPYIHEIVAQLDVPYLKDIKDNDAFNAIFASVFGYAGYDLVSFAINKVTGGKNLKEDEAE
jgi:hypothetical protein